MAPQLDQDEVGQDEVVAALHRVAFLLEREQASSYRCAAYRGAGDRLRELDEADWDQHRRADSWQQISGVGARTADAVREVLAGSTPDVLAELEADLAEREGRSTAAGRRLREAICGDLHSHTEASDGSAALEDMALAAVQIGHEYLAVTDHSPRLTVAHGLTPARLRRQMARISRANEVLAPFRLLRGIEVDVLDDGGLDQEPALLDELDVVVASVHSKLRMDRAAMTRRMLAAVRGPSIDVLGHCTGRRVLGRERPPSDFDARAVFEACAEHEVAVEVNSRPDRQDPPEDLIAIAAEVGCLFTVDSDAHAPGQLDWLVDGCDRLAAHGVEPDRVVTTWPVERLLAWTGRR
ncbi:PHP domain-containing protein [Actinotalea sp. C106]|uniref:PHP domain-containing protein n=1 Tax=Actinotalea sp. C106 TaxID=2908644 RepID=UPI002027C5E0|nr:PHP domain-containing protein [Actinotalea sp. C106]